MEREFKTAARWWAELLRKAGYAEELLSIFEKEIAEELRDRYNEDGKEAWIEYGFVPDNGLFRRASNAGIRLEGKEEALQHHYMTLHPGHVTLRTGIEGLNASEPEELELLET